VLAESVAAVAAPALFLTSDVTLAAARFTGAISVNHVSKQVISDFNSWCNGHNRWKQGSLPRLGGLFDLSHVIFSFGCQFIS
jgi:hypothetical protein